MGALVDRDITRRGFLVGSAGVGTAIASTTMVACGKKEPGKIAIVYTNDTHGHDLLDSESMGMAAAVQLVSDYKDKGYEVLFFDAGDAVQGTSLVDYSKGDTAIDFMNEAGYQVMVLGNHEFDFGQDKLAEYVSTASFPIISANIVVDATGDLLVAPNTTFTLHDGRKMGVFGLTTPETYTKANPMLVQGLTFLQGEELYACAQKQADQLRSERCDLVVCLAHLGEAEGSAPNRACDVIEHTKGIDLVIDGHDHEEENQFITNAAGEDTLVVETGCYTHAVGVITWEDGVLKNNLEAFGSYEGQDEKVAAYIQSVADQQQAELTEVVAHTAYYLDGERMPGLRNHETNLGDLVADAIFWEADQMADDRPDCAIINAGSIRDSIQEGDITLNTVLTVLPFLNYITTVQVKGSQLLEALEASCFTAPDELGGFPQVSGITFTVDTTVPYEAGETYPLSTYTKPANPGARVTIDDVGGRGFSPDDTYVIATNDFISAGGDTYYVFAEAAQATMKSINYLVSDAFRYYLEEALAGEVSEQYADSKGEGRITVIV